MSNCCANSASVLSPRTAARATFALKAGVWFRRGRLVIVSPGLQPFWLLSGRNSTYPAVQISRASSMLALRGIEVSHETIRQWGLKFGQEFANIIRRRLPRPGDKWHMDLRHEVA